MEKSKLKLLLLRNLSTLGMLGMLNKSEGRGGSLGLGKLGGGGGGGGGGEKKCWCCDLLCWKNHFRRACSASIESPSP